MAKRKRPSAAERRRNLVLALSAIAVLLAIALLSIPRAPISRGGGSAETGAGEVTETERNQESRESGTGEPIPPDAPVESYPDGRVPTTEAPAPGQAAESGSAPSAEKPRSSQDEAPSLSAAPAASGTGRIAIVIDDVGNSLEDLEPFLGFPGKITFAVLPSLANSREAARRAREAGKEVIVHMPMAAMDGTYPGPGTIRPGEDPHRMISLIAENLSTVPGAVGVNNHMGSLMTADEESMGILLGYLKARGLFFLDSRTTAESVIPTVAPSVGIPWLERDVFLDNEPTREYVVKALEQGLKIARSEGHAVMIGHAPNRIVASVLKSNYDRLRELGYRFVTLQELSVPSVAEATGS